MPRAKPASRVKGAFTHLTWLSYLLCFYYQNAVASASKVGFASIRTTTFPRACFLPAPTSHHHQGRQASTRLHAKKSSSGDKSKGPASSSMRGFGVFSKKPTQSCASQDYELIVESDVLEMVRWLQNSGASLSGLALARFPKKGDLRGVVALKPFKKGDIIVSIPQDVAIDLGGSSDPGAVGLNLLKIIQSSRTESKASPQAAYLRLLPQLGGADYSTTTDFFTPQELEMLQFPPVQQETVKRVEKIRALAEKSGVSEDDLKWAVWLVVSRVIAVKLPELGLHKLLIPFLDLFNHDGGSPHTLSPGVVSGSNKIMLCVVAGSDIAEGEEVCFPYGAGMLASDRMVQDYGFLDAASTATADARLVKGQSNEVLKALQATTISEDESLLQSSSLTPNEAMAVRFRLILKRAIAAKS